jgi:hypothetical protein
MPQKTAISIGDRLRIVVLGYIVRGPIGGLAWHHLQYVMGLAELGHDVRFLEDSGDTPWCCYDPSRDLTDSDPTYGLKFAADAFTFCGLPEHWAYRDAHTDRWFGPSASRVQAICTDADLLLNLSGANPIRPWLEHVPVRALVDTDPAFTQVRHLTDPTRRRQAEQHTAFFSYAENVGRGASIPDDGLPWRATRQPIVLGAWPVVPGPRDGKFTTVMQWDSYATREYDGRRFGMKSESFMKYLDLPRKVGPVFELAVGGAEAQMLLEEHGWGVRNPNKLIPDPPSFQRFVQSSKAEFTVAKQGYVSTRSGWFSDRSAAYLASGRPVITENTGCGDWLAVGEGCLTFDDIDEAIQAISEVNHHYDRHSHMARAIAEEYFDAGRVLSSLIERALNSEHSSEPASTLDPASGAIEW